MNASPKKLGVIIGGALAALVILALVVGVPMWERSQAENIRAFLTDLPGDVKVEKVEVSFFGSKVTVTNLTGDFTVMPGLQYTLKIARAEATGINTSAAKTMSVTKLADSLSITDFSFESNFDGIAQKGALKEMSLRDIRMNLGGLVDSVKGKTDLAAMFSSLATLHIGQLAYVDYVTSTDFGMSPIIVSMASVEGKDVGILQCGPMSINDLKAKFMGQDVVTMQSMSVGRVSMPDFISPLLAFTDDPYMLQFQAATVLQQKFSREPLIMEGLTFKGLYIGGLIDSPVTMESFSMDVKAGGDSIIVKSSMDSLVLPPFVLEQMGSEFRSFAKVYGKSLDLSGAMDMQLVVKDGNMDISFTGNASDKNLGSGATTWALSSPVGGAKDIFDALGRSNPLLQSVTLSLKDSGMLAVMFDAVYDYESRWGMEDGINSGADMRRAAAEEIYQEAREADTKEQRDVLNGFGAFLEKGGSLDITATAAKPVSVEVIDHPYLLKEGDIAVTVEHKE